MDISIIVPIYKGNKYISPIMEMTKKNINYLNAQGKTLDIELILVNDYPETPIFLERIDAGFNVIVIENETNVGIHQSRVNGLKMANGQYVLFLDQDDEIFDNCLYSQYMKIFDYDMVIGNGYNYRDIH